MNIYHSTRSVPYVYICTHKTTYEFYIGYREKNVSLHRPSNIDLPIYRTSSQYVKYRFEEFNWVIIAEFLDGSSAYDFEQLLIQENWENPLLVNQQFHTGKITQFRNNGHSEDTKQKMRKPKPPRTEEHCRNISNGKLGKKLSPKTEEHCRNISNGKLGKKRSIVHYRPHTPETKAKISASKQNPSEETRNKMSEAARNQKKVKCPFCDKIGNITPMKRWHFENCKQQNT
jgi:hypothetical protein